MSNKMITWLENLSSNAELAVRLYCSMKGESSFAIRQFVMEIAYLAGCSEIIKEDIQESILQYYKNKEKKVVLLVA